MSTTNKFLLLFSTLLWSSCTDEAVDPFLWQVRSVHSLSGMQRIALALDDADSTAWTSSKGLGVGEGFFVDFEGARFVKSLQIISPVDLGCNPITSIELYLNGIFIDTIRPNQRYLVRQEVQAIYLKIKTVASEQQLTGYTENEIHQFTVSDTSKRVAISELRLRSAEDSLFHFALPLFVQLQNTRELLPLFDHRKEFAFVLDSSESFRLSFKDEQMLTSIAIINGNQLNSIAYQQHARIRKLQISNEYGETLRFDLQDSTSEQKLIFDKPLRGTQYLLTVLATFDGTTNHIAISELKLYAHDQRVIPIFPEKQSKHWFHNKRMLSTIRSEDGVIIKQNELLLRQNGSFLYREFSSQGKRWMNGFWHLLDEQTVHLQGKQQDTTSDEARSFSENLYINTQTVQGNETIRPFRLDFRESDMVEINQLDTSFLLDLRYATVNNFTHTQLYDCARCFVRYQVAKDLILANEEFKRLGYRIKIFDGFRPQSVQYRMFEVFPIAGYVADPAKGSVHSRGGAVDLTLVDKQGNELDMGTPFDYFGRKAGHYCTSLPDTVLQNRIFLKTVLQKYHFMPIRGEWWHYNHQQARKFPLSEFEIPCY